MLMDNLVFESVFYKGTSKIALLFEIFLRLYQLQMRLYFILHVVHIAGTSIIEEGIYGLSRGNNLGLMMRVLNPLQFVSLDQGVVVISAKLEPWIRTLWVDILTSLSAKDWFGHKGDNILWDPPTAAAETSL